MMYRCDSAGGCSFSAAGICNLKRGCAERGVGVKRAELAHWCHPLFWFVAGLFIVHRGSSVHPHHAVILLDDAVKLLECLPCWEGASVVGGLQRGPPARHGNMGVPFLEDPEENILHVGWLLNILGILVCLQKRSWSNAMEGWANTRCRQRG